MARGYEDLRGFLKHLESRGELVRVTAPVDPVLEVNAILDRLARVQGPAVLFENVRGSSLPLLGNLYGTKRRVSAAFGVEDFDALVDGMVDDFHRLMGRESQDLLLSLGARGIAEKLRGIKAGLASGSLRQAAAGVKKALPLLPRRVKGRNAPCKEVILTGDDVDLTRFPLIKCWPQDGGLYATYPLVISRDPENGSLNLGIYRMMLLGKNRMCMHWLPQKHGFQHYAKYERLGREMPVVVAFGGDPALEVGGVFQLMPPLDEFMVAGMLKGSPVSLATAEDSDLPVPAGAEIVLEGVVPPGERADEGPFGEFNGFYSPIKQTPVFHVRKATMRKRPIWHAATTGMPPTEIHVLAKSMERIGLAMARVFYPGIRDLNLTVESGTLYIMVAALEKTRPYEAQDLMHFLWSAASQSPYVTNIFVVDAGTDAHDMSAVLAQIARNVRPGQDIFVTPRGLADLEKPSTYPRGVGARMGVDATSKWPQEGMEAETAGAPAGESAMRRCREAAASYGPGLKDISLRADGPTLTIMAALKKSEAFEAQKLMRFFWERCQGLAPTINVFVADEDVIVHDLGRVFWAIAMHMRPEQDMILRGGGPEAAGFGLDATAKRADEGMGRELPPLISMDRDILKRVEKNWLAYGLPPEFKP